MAAISPDAREHRRRMLAHQQKIEAQQPSAGSPRPDPQLKIPLVGEVRRGAEVSAPKAKRPPAQKRVQPKLGEL